jgi:hypothetical protein
VGCSDVATYWSAVHNAVRPLDGEAREKFSNFQAKLSRRAEHVENEFLGRFWIAVQGEHPLVL